MASMISVSQTEGLTKDFAKSICEIKIGDLPAHIIHKTERLILDSLGCAVYGSSTPWGGAVVDYVQGLGSRPLSSVVAHPFKTDPASAALANGTMAHAYELDDVFMIGKMHPGAVVIPAALAVAESIHADGPSLMQAVIAGYEAMGRVGLGLGANATKRRGWHITGVAGTFGGAAAAGRLLGLDAHQMASAFGIAGTQSAGLFAFIADGSMTKRFHAGRSAQSGIMAAMLAQKGLEGPTQVLEAPDGGLLKTISDGSDANRVLRGPDERFVVEQVGYKLYSCCGSIHPAIDAAREIVDKHNVKEGDVEAVEVGVSDVVIRQCGWDYEPLSTLQAQMSMKYCVAVAIREGDAFIKQFTDQEIRDPKTLELAKRVGVSVDPRAQKEYPAKNPASVTIKLKDGKKWNLYVDEPRGLSEERIATDADLTRKFSTLTEGIIGKEKSKAVIDSVLALDKLHDTAQLTALLQ